MERWGISILRITVGIVFMMHGGQKLFIYGIGGTAGAMAQLGLPLPLASAVLATGAELLGGFALALGLGTRFAAGPLAFTMLVAILTAHLKAGFFLPAGFEYPLVLLSASVALLLTGGGALALENVIGRKHDSSPSLERTGSRQPRLA